jgi:diguanylate cyclase (GGDEF)-like protein/PAS domain S-box-containing protein
MTTILQPLLANLALGALFTALAIHVRAPVDRQATVLWMLIFGLLTGLGVVVLMQFPFHFSDGVLIDLRSTLIGLVTFFAGPIAGGVAALISGFYRFHLGGAGVGAGLLAIAGAFGVGLAGHALTRGRAVMWFDVAYLGMGTASSSILAFLLLPEEIIARAFNEAALPFGIVLFLSTFVFGSAVVHDRHRRAALAQNQIYRAVIEALPDCLNAKDLEGRFLVANPATARLMQAVSAEALIGRTDYDFYPAEVAAGFRKEEEHVMATGRGEPVEQHIVHDDGAECWVETLKVPLRDENDRLVGLITHNRDITAQHHLRLELERNRELLSDALTHMADGLAMFDRDDRLVFCNDQYRSFFPRTAEIRRPGVALERIVRESIACGEQTVGSAADAEARVASIMASLKVAGERVIPLADGRFVEARTRPVREGCLVVYSDVTATTLAEDALRSLNEQLKFLADTDTLTGLANRRVFDQALEREVAQSQRAGRPLSLLLIDVDRFKAFNDTYGHPAGDECLRRVSTVLRETVRRPLDLAARYGGEEMAVLLPETGLGGAVDLAEEVRRAVRSLAIAHTGSEKGIVTVSVGAAVLTGGQGARDLLRQADEALYAAKGGGRDRVRSYDPARLIISKLQAVTGQA